MIPEPGGFPLGCDAHVIAIEAVSNFLLFVTVQDMITLHHGYLNTTADENCYYWT